MNVGSCDLMACPSSTQQCSTSLETTGSVKRKHCVSEDQKRKSGITPSTTPSFSFSSLILDTFPVETPLCSLYRIECVNKVTELTKPAPQIFPPDLFAHYDFQWDHCFEAIEAMQCVPPICFFAYLYIGNILRNTCYSQTSFGIFYTDE